MAAVVTDIHEWLQANEKYFEPPICNKMLHQKGQMKVFFVGGPNVRKDFHIEEGEEFFLMLKGNMCLKVLEKGAFRDIHISQGEAFLLPARIPHSPQRQADTMGLVIERERQPEEMDCLRYYVEDSTDVLYERWFHCVDLGTQLGPLIKEFFQSQQFKTGKPNPESLTGKRSFEVDCERTLGSPFSVSEWLGTNKENISQLGRMDLFNEHHKFRVSMFGKGEFSGCSEDAETFFWQWEGNCILTSKTTNEKLGVKQTALVSVGESWTLRNEGFTLQVISSA